ncbi:aconitate hydratase AcnA [Leucothrix arctica]|uniref:Aconitate hydratase n=1 Tax=Leucothrix arctica TaxID=1481894 RepID=A0A317C6A5_9GAMM|nr:aconitate hydratase AcnA [Leucothrix arctica]PWQ93809.1 aconitate hydratase AcnA [Leucothrix arctica]
MDTFSSLNTLNAGNSNHHYYSLDALQPRYNIKRLPFCLKILLENLLRHEDGQIVTDKQIKAIAQWQPQVKSVEQIAFTPARVILQDFTGVPALVDLAAMRDAISELGGDANLINPLEKVDLVIDHSVMVDKSGTPDALDLNTKLEFHRNKERYQFLRWGQESFDNFRVVPPGTGIVHQVNLEYLADVVSTKQGTQLVAYPDTLVGTDSHTTMINGLGVLGWGVGGIEAEAAMLGQPLSMLVPEVVGFEFKGKLIAGTTATDLVLMVTELLRDKGVVGKFVEFFGDGISSLSLADRATISNMAPEYGATCGFFPVDDETLHYLRLSGRSEDAVNLVEAYCKAQYLWRSDGDTPAEYSDLVSFDLHKVVPSIAGPKRPQDRISLLDAANSFRKILDHESLDKEVSLGSVMNFEDDGGNADTDINEITSQSSVKINLDGFNHSLDHGDIVIAAITSCTNTSNPAVMIAAGLLAKKAINLGLTAKPWVKTSLAPGSQVVPQYLDDAGLMEPLRMLGFDVVGFGCTTCIGNSGPLSPVIDQAIEKGDLNVAAVLSGNRNFEGRIHQSIKSNYLASPPLVVAYALAGSMLHDLYKDPLGNDFSGMPVFLADIWPEQREINAYIEKYVSAEIFKSRYADVFAGTEDWKKLETPEGSLYTWSESTYVRRPPYFEGMTLKIEPLKPINDARCLVMVGDSITTDHISPAGAIAVGSPAAEYLASKGVQKEDYNSLGSRRGNHEVMMRGTFANNRLRNLLAPGTEGGFTRHFPDATDTTIFAAAMLYAEEKVPLIVIAGKEYGTGSSRDWAAKGPKLLGVHAVIAQSYERIHRSNLVGFGILPLQFCDNDSAETLGLKGDELFSIESPEGHPDTLKVTAKHPDRLLIEFETKVRIDTYIEWRYYEHGGILHYVLRDLALKQST